MSTVGIHIPKRLTVLFFIGLFSAAAMAAVGPNWIEQWGITWTFDKNISTDGAPGTYQYGTFANGDYWIKGPVNLIGITPESRKIQQNNEKDSEGKTWPYTHPTFSTQKWDFTYIYDDLVAATIYTNDTSNLQLPRTNILVRSTGNPNIDNHLIEFRAVLETNVSFRVYLRGKTSVAAWGTITGGTFGDYHTINGSMINPTAKSVQGFVSRTMSGIPYDPRLNAARPNGENLSASNPLEVSIGSSLISTISRVYGTSGSADWPSLKNAAVLTVLKEAPPAGSFRPAYCGSDKTIKFNVSDLNYSVFQKHVPVAGVPSPAVVQDNFERLWLVHGPSSAYHNLAPTSQMPAYGGAFLWYISQAALALNMDYSDAAKETLLIRYVQLGIDLHGVTQNDGNNIWISDGGHHAGRKLPIMVAGKALNDAGMLGIGEKSGDYLYSAKIGGGNYGPGDKPADYIAFAEDEQTFYVTQWHVDNSQQTYDHYFGSDPKPSLPSPAWTPGQSGQPLMWSYWDVNGGVYPLSRPFAASDIGVPEFGHRHATYPGTSVPAWVSCGDYRGISDSYYPVEALVALMMGLKDIWNHDAFFDYADRRVQVVGKADGVYGGSFTAAWNTYRADYGPIWPNTGTTPTTYTLSVSTANGTVTKSPNKTSYSSGEVVTLTAAPNAGYTFGSWTGSITGTTNPVTVIMNGNKAVTATLTQIAAPTYTLTLTAANGSITRSPSKTTYTHGESVTLTATANTGYTFGNWSGNATGTANPVTITMDGNKSVTATFVPASVTIDPVAHWLFNEPYQSAAVDVVSGQSASLVNDPVWGEGWAREYFVRLDSGRQAVQIPMSRCSPAAGTIALWAMPENSSAMQVLFGHALSSTANRVAVYLAAGKLAVGLGDTLQGNIATLAVGQMQHIAVTWLGTSYAVYVNGIQKTVGTFGGLTQLNAFADVGNYGNAAFYNDALGFRGVVEDVQLYSRSLVANEINALFLTHTIRENRPVEFVINGRDQSGNPISYTANNLPQGAVFNSQMQTFSWRPALYNAAGRYNIRFTAAGQPEQIVTVFVQDVGLAGWYRDFLVRAEPQLKF